MGLFSKTSKPDPTITVDGIEIVFHLDNEWWDFKYRGTPFCSWDHALQLPTKAELDAILATIEAMKPEMRKRLEAELSEWDGAKLDDGESYLVNVQEYGTNKIFSVSWSDGASWGDLGVDFSIKDSAIVDESWGD